MKKVYVAVWQDRHSDTSVEVFTDREAAMAWASKTANDYSRDDEEVLNTLNPAMIAAGWIYYGCYSCEGDHIRVSEIEVDEQVYK